MSLKDLLKRIDLIDFSVVKLLNERMELSLRAEKLQQNGDDPGAYENETEHVRKYFKGLVDEQFQKALFDKFEKETRKLKEKGLQLIGFQGEHGAFGDVAARGFDDSLAPIPCLEFVDVFDGVEKGQLDLGIVPVENSLEGAVTHVNDLLIERDLKIVGEIDVEVTHCLLALPETDYREIKVVYSHPQALAQCRGFLLRNRLEPRPYYDTAGAARMISRDRPKASAAIASSLCAKLYNLEVIKERIEDHIANFTRFIIISKEESKEEGVKCSIIFSTAHKVGTLYEVLKIFADAELNLTRIESRPSRNDPRSYAFLLDFVGSEKEHRVQKALEKTKQMASFYKYLGCYKEARI